MLNTRFYLRQKRTEKRAEIIVQNLYQIVYWIAIGILYFFFGAKVFWTMLTLSIGIRILVIIYYFLADILD